MTQEEYEDCRKAFFDCQHVSRDQFPAWLAAWEVAIEYQKARSQLEEKQK